MSEDGSILAKTYNIIIISKFLYLWNLMLKFFLIKY